jgi:beta-lactamase class A
MKINKFKPIRLSLSAPLILLLIFITAFWASPFEKTQVSTYPSLWESFDQDFQQALETTLRKEFRGKDKDTIENKKVALVVVDINNLHQPRVAGVNTDVMMYAASLPKIAILLGAFVKIERGEMPLNSSLGSVS